ncbi:MAG: hypothetical protein HOI53_04160, partial [Francisellaceae bacterium]|nr:hypothetical protein [Francisellaceae bacterium]
MIIESEVLESVFPGVADKIDSPVHGVAIDSRMVKEGEIFFAIIGGNNDGHVYIKQAISNGAIAVVVQHGYDAATSVPVIIVEDTTKAL